MKWIMKWFGLLGVIVCLAAAVVVWFTGSRLSQASDKVLDGVDSTLAACRDRVLGAQKRVQEAKITTEDVRHGVENWVRMAATERLASRVDVEHKVGRLASGLEQADRWLEVSGASLHGVQQALDMARSLGSSADQANVNPLLERLEGVRGQLKQASAAVDAIREQLASAAEGATLEERIKRAAQLALRVLATVGEIDSHLGQVADGLIERQARVQQLKRQTHVYIVAAQVCLLLLIAWMAAGQVSLWRYSWRR